MNTEPINCRVGSGYDEHGQTVRVNYAPAHPFFHDGKERVSVIIGTGIHAEGPCLPAKEILRFQPTHAVWKELGGERKFEEFIKEAPAWFERKCRESNCEWFVPIVRRMAAGEPVPLEELQSAYLAHNGKVMSSAKWGEEIP